MRRMEPTTLSYAVDTASVAALAVGVTQLVKDLGVQGQILKLVCVVAGCLAWATAVAFPDAWHSLIGVLIALSSTGLVSFVDERLQKKPLD